MAFIKGYQLNGGILSGSVFDTTVVDASTTDLSPAPIYNPGTWQQAGFGSGYVGVHDGNSFGGIRFDPAVSMNVTGWGNYNYLGALEIRGTTYYKRELRFYVDRSAIVGDSDNYYFNWRLTVKIRTYTDASTYTDVQLVQCPDIQYHHDSNAHVMASYIVFGNIVSGGHHYVLFGTSSMQSRGLTIEWLGGFLYNDYNNFYTTIGGDIPETEFDPDYGPASDEGGYGPGGGGAGGPGPTFDGESDPWVDYTVKPGIAALGLVNLYECDANSLVNLGAELFPDIHWPTSLSDVGEVLAAVSDSIWNSKLIDYIISAHIIPVDVTGGNLTDIKVGTRTMTGIMARPISDDIIEFDCGSVHIDEYYTSFVDYLTRCRLYLPFYGFIEVKPEYWQSATLQVKYYFNVIDGSFIARVYSTITRHQKPFKSLIGQYTGCACVHVPMTGSCYASMFGGMISGAAGVAAGLATSNPALAATSALNVAASSAGQMQMSNPYNASAGFYGHPCPYLIIERPVSHFPTRYANEKGFPLLVSKTVGSCSGFTQADDIILDGIPCTDAEKEKIRALFKSGVIIKAIN